MDCDSGNPDYSLSKTLKYEYIDGKRQGSKILHLSDESQLFLFKYQCPGRYTHYKCYVPGCRASVNMTSEGVIEVKSMSKSNHCHPPQTETISNLKLLKTLKEACTDPSLSKAKVRDIYKTYVDESKHVPRELQFNRISRSLFRIREKALGQVCSELSEDSVVMPKTGRKPNSNDNFEGLPEINDVILKTETKDEAKIVHYDNLELKSEAGTNYSTTPIYAIVKEELEIFDIEESTSLTPCNVEVKTEEIFDIFEIEENDATPTNEANQTEVRWMPFDFIEGRRKSGKLVHVLEEDQLYRFRSRYNDQFSYYRCYINKCNAIVKVQSGVNFCFRTSNRNHKHEVQTDLIKEMKMVSAIKADCEDPSKSHKSIKQILEKYDTGDPQKKAIFRRIERNLIRIRAKTTNGS